MDPVVSQQNTTSTMPAEGPSTDILEIVFVFSLAGASFYFFPFSYFFSFFSFFYFVSFFYLTTFLAGGLGSALAAIFFYFFLATT